MKISKSAIFLFEIMFVILVFTASAAICANIFGQSYQYSKNSENLAQAVLIAESTAEEFKADPKFDEAREWTRYYKKDWSLTESKSKAAYEMHVTVAVNDGTAVCDIAFNDDIYSLTAKKAVTG